MSGSVNTNVAAMIALQNLSQTNKELEDVQNRINTGLKVATAKDDGAAFAIAQNMRGEVAGYNAVLERLDAGRSVVDVAVNAGSRISELLTEMKKKAVAAADPAADSNQRTAYDNDFQALVVQIGVIVKNASFNSLNLIDGNTATLNVIANTTGGSNNWIAIAHQDMSATGGLGITTTTALTTQTDAEAAITAVNTAIGSASTKLGKLGVGSLSLTTHTKFVTGLVDTFKAGIGNLVDANLPEESAKLQALQVKQQLGTQALSIANQAPQIILSLFRG